MPISQTRRRHLHAQASYRCEYCQIAKWPLTIDHVVPSVAWRSTSPPPFDPDDPDYLAAACGVCNRAKWGATISHDPLTGAEQPLFHPRRDRWDEHFAWANDYQEIAGITPVGRATVAQLGLNRAVYRLQRRLLRAALRAGEAPWP